MKYKNLIIEMIGKIENEKLLKKIYSYINFLFVRQN